MIYSSSNLLKTLLRCGVAQFAPVLPEFCLGHHLGKPCILIHMTLHTFRVSFVSESLRPTTDLHTTPLGGMQGVSIAGLMSAPGTERKEESPLCPVCMSACKRGGDHRSKNDRWRFWALGCSGMGQCCSRVPFTLTFVRRAKQHVILKQRS